MALAKGEKPTAKEGFESNREDDGAAEPKTKLRPPDTSHSLLCTSTAVPICRGVFLCMLFKIKASV